MDAFFSQLQNQTGFNPSAGTRKRAEYVCRSVNIEMYAVNEENGERANDRTRVEIKYEHPFFSQFIGRFFGEKSANSNAYVYQFSESLDVPLEIARSTNGKLGIKQEKTP